MMDEGASGRFNHVKRVHNSSVIGHKDVRENRDVSRTIGNLHDELTHEEGNY